MFPQGVTMDATVRKQTGFKNKCLNKFSCKNGQVVFFFKCFSKSTLIVQLSEPVDFLFDFAIHTWSLGRHNVLCNSSQLFQIIDSVHLMHSTSVNVYILNVLFPCSFFHECSHMFDSHELIHIVKNKTNKTKTVCLMLPGSISLALGLEIFLRSGLATCALFLIKLLGIAKSQENAKH